MADQTKRPAGSAGLTLIEIVIVVAIIGVLAGAIIFPRVISNLDTARTNRGYDGANEIRAAMLRYWTAEEQWPSTAATDLEALQVQLTGYLSSTLPIPNIIRNPASGTFYQIMGGNKDFRIRVEVANRAGDVLCIQEEGIIKEVGGACP